MPHESAPIGRAAASTINPLIGSFTEDSLSNLSRMVCDLGYLLSQVDNPPEGTEPCFGSLYLLCVEALIKKRLPDRIIEDVIALQQQYRCLLWAVEAVQFQEFLRSELIKRGAARGIPIPARGVNPNSDKTLRIESLQPHVANGLIRLHASQVTLIDQLRHFPLADHDDGPDALEMLWSAAVKFCGASAAGFQSARRWAPTSPGWGDDDALRHGGSRRIY